jgi:hypothetical protein
MSGVLDRMVQRSRGQLPAIEPLVRSEQTAAAAVPVVVEESAAAASRGRNAAVSGGKRASREESAGLVQDKARRDVTQSIVPALRDSRRFGALEVAPVKRAAESDGAPAAKDAGQDGWKMAREERVAESRDLPQRREESYELSIGRLPEKELAKPEDSIGEIIRLKAEVEQRAAMPDISAARKQADAVASANNEPEQTEIHITIGSVELRSPRVAPVAPKAPPFKPRVTLDEFLKRGSGGRGARS